MELLPSPLSLARTPRRRNAASSPNPGSSTGFNIESDVPLSSGSLFHFPKDSRLACEYILNSVSLNYANGALTVSLERDKTRLCGRALYLALCVSNRTNRYDSTWLLSCYLNSVRITRLACSPSLRLVESLHHNRTARFRERRDPEYRGTEGR